jgi:hypothetical protein
MRHIIFRLSIALLTFIIGTTAAVIWASFHRPISKGIAESSSPANFLNQQLATANQNPEEETLTYEQGLYSNYDYAYSIRIPDGLIGYRSPAPNPNHGFGIDLSKEDDAQVWTDASYNSMEWTSFDDAIKSELDYLKDKSISNIQLVGRSSTRLSGLRAVRFIINYMRSGIPRVQEIILAFRKDAGIVYTLDLRTTSLRYSEDRKVMNKLQKTFRLEQLPYP